MSQVIQIIIDGDKLEIQALLTTVIQFVLVAVVNNYLNNSNLLFGIYCVPRTMLSTLHILPY